MSTHGPHDVSLDTLLHIFRTHARTFWTVLILSLMLAVSVWALQPTAYAVHVLLDVARIGETADTPDYTYDAYYRLQADEQFGETVAHWLRTPRVVDDVLRTAAAPVPATLRARERFFRAHRVSPQSIVVTYTVTNPLVGTRIAQAMGKQLNARVAALNYTAPRAPWFAVKVSDPVIARDTTPLWLALAAGGVGGTVGGGLFVLVLHAVRGARRTQQA